VHAGAQRAEAGFDDPALGWIGVRANLAGGAVHAAVLPGSAEAAQALSGHIAALNVHLAEHRIAVDSVSMAAPARPDPGSGHGGFEQERGQYQGQPGGQQPTAGESRDQPRQSSIRSLASPARQGGSEPGGVTGLAPATGRHISVMA
jgi:hypothetical protein